LLIRAKLPLLADPVAADKARSLQAVGLSGDGGVTQPERSGQVGEGALPLRPQVELGQQASLGVRAEERQKWRGSSRHRAVRAQVGALYAR
jgi:hypothetical protein